MIAPRAKKLLLEYEYRKPLVYGAKATMDVNVKGGVLVDVADVLSVIKAGTGRR